MSSADDSPRHTCGCSRTPTGEDGSACDLSPLDHQERITDAVTAIAARREVIDHAMGMLMLTYGLDATGAFELLRWQSQQHNVKLRLVAERIIADFTALTRNTPPANRLDYDNLLLTAHLPPHLPTGQLPAA